MSEARFPFSISTKTTSLNRLNAEADTQSLLASIRADTEEICKKCKATPLFSLLIFHFGKLVIFIKLYPLH